MAMTPLSDSLPKPLLGRSPVMAMLCLRCDVTWRGPSDGPCWSCGLQGEPASPATTVVD
ncbi:MAG: hypothetical protein ACR2QE_21060 [Acidimicrobiales bacterium]